MKKRNLISLIILLIIGLIFFFVNNKTDRIQNQKFISVDIIQFQSNAYYQQEFPNVILKTIPDPDHGVILEVSGKVANGETLLKLKEYFKNRAYNDIEEHKKHVKNLPMFKSVPMRLVDYKVKVE
ncbi:MAG: hypothetical protein M0R48_06290 [Candidatus Omnitrophica bacterium]|nr:hypothetical protein [Candidatus Omnitrophota bacterium]